MPASEFFEKGHYFHLPEYRMFAFAALWEKWRGHEGEVCSCTMLTTEPNAEVRGVGHHRMPVLLTGEEQYERVAQVGVARLPQRRSCSRLATSGILEGFLPLLGPGSRGRQPGPPT